MDYNEIMKQERKLDRKEKIVVGVVLGSMVGSAAIGVGLGAYGILSGKTDTFLPYAIITALMGATISLGAITLLTKSDYFQTDEQYKYEVKPPSADAPLADAPESHELRPVYESPYRPYRP